MIRTFRFPAFTLLACLIAIILPSIGAETGAAQEAEKKRKGEAFANPQDNPELPNVLIIGDSISIGYTPFVRQHLKEQADVFRIHDNGKFSTYGLERLDRWLGDRQWDLIHFNWGLWDLCYRNPKSKAQGNRDKVNGTLTTTPEDYRENLEQIVERLQSTGAKLVWCATTPVPENEVGRRVGDDIIYNKIAAEVMQAHDIAINDLHSHARLELPAIQIRKGDVHFTEAGSRHLADKVSEEIATALSE